VNFDGRCARDRSGTPTPCSNSAAGTVREFAPGPEAAIGLFTQPDALLKVLRGIVARVVAAREELEIDNGAAARAILSDLEEDLAVLVERGFLR
jgi:hypothetical protein